MSPVFVWVLGLDIFEARNVLLDLVNAIQNQIGTPIPTLGLILAGLKADLFEQAFARLGFSNSATRPSQDPEDQQIPKVGAWWISVL